MHERHGHQHPKPIRRSTFVVVSSVVATLVALSLHTPQSHDQSDYYYLYTRRSTD